MTAMIEIQRELKAPKGQVNKFGGYKYRSCEDIVEAVKPLLSKHSVYLNISDDIVAVQDRVYVKATAYVVDADNKVIASATGFAREAPTKKGMDDSQITGAASSYARKYALNGLFAIDDTADADTQDNTAQDSAGYHVDVERIKSAANMDELKAAYTEAHYNHKDNKAALQACTEAKDARKKELVND